MSLYHSQCSKYIYIYFKISKLSYLADEISNKYEYIQNNENYVRL